MKTTVAVISPTSIRLEFHFMAGVFPTSVFAEGKPFYYGINPAGSVNYKQIELVNYVVDTNGVINVTDISLNLITRNASNVNSKLQISGNGGDEGGTWVDVTDDIPGDGVNDFVRRGSGQWLSNIKVGKTPLGKGMLQIRLLVRAVDGNPGNAGLRADSSVSIVYNKIISGSALPAPSFPSTLGRGFVSGGRDAVGNIGNTDRFDDVANAWTARAAITARRNLSGYSFGLSDFGFTSGGFIAAITGATERFDDIANTQTGVTAITARTSLTGWSLSLPPKQLPDSYGYTSCGADNGNDFGTTERYDNVANTQTARIAATARRFPAGYGMFGAGFTSAGYAAGVSVGTTERLNDVANTWTARTAAVARFGLAGYSIGELGIDPLYTDIHPFGFSSGGGGPTVGTTERFDDFSNAHTLRTAITPRYRLAGFSMIGYGYASCGFDGAGARTGLTERFDDVANTQTARTDNPTARDSPAGYSLEEYFINYTG